jgi:F-type H+-transporting ATPase subunit a
MHHVQDTGKGDEAKWEFFQYLFGGKSIKLPSINLFGYELQITKFMILEIIAALLLIAIFIPIARKARNGSLPRGRWWNAFEAVLQFIRNEVARPNLKDQADKYVPYLWTVFLFILFCNLLGMIPFMGSPTASIWVTGGLAVCSFVMLHGAAIVQFGPIKYVKSLWPHIEIAPNPWGKSGDGHGHGHDDHGHAAPAHQEHAAPPAAKPTVGQILSWLGGSAFGLVLSTMIFTIEFLGTFIKSGVLAVRLFANMFAGHMVLGSLLLFIYTVGNAAGFGGLWVGVTVASVLGVVALSLLELFVAFLQAYVFTFLTALFMGMGLHPEH